MNKINKQSLLQRIFLGELYRNYDLKDFDWGIIFSVFFLTLFGIIMVSSVSLPLTEGSFSLIISHISKVIIALIIFLLIFRFPTNFWSKVDIQILLIAFFLLFFSLCANYRTRGKWCKSMDKSFWVHYTTFRINEICFDNLHFFLLLKEIR